MLTQPLPALAIDYLTAYYFLWFCHRHHHRFRDGIFSPFNASALHKTCIYAFFQVCTLTRIGNGATLSHSKSTLSDRANIHSTFFSFVLKLKASCFYDFSHFSVKFIMLTFGNVCKRRTREKVFVSIDFYTCRGGSSEPRTRYRHKE